MSKKKKTQIKMLNAECYKCYRFLFGQGMYKCKGQNSLMPCNIFMKVGGDNNGKDNRMYKGSI